MNLHMNGGFIIAYDAVTLSSKVAGRRLQCCCRHRHSAEIWIAGDGWTTRWSGRRWLEALGAREQQSGQQTDFIPLNFLLLAPLWTFRSKFGLPRSLDSNSTQNNINKLSRKGFHQHRASLNLLCLLSSEGKRCCCCRQVNTNVHNNIASYLARYLYALTKCSRLAKLN